MSIKQKSKIIITTDGAEIEVSRMKWKAARSFLRMVAEQLGAMFKEGSLVDALRKAKEAQTEGEALNVIGAILDSLPNIITGSLDISSHLMRSCTALTPEQIDNLDLPDALAVIAAALELNADDDLKNSLAGIAGRVVALLPAKKN
jgi:hypothetical protein